MIDELVATTKKEQADDDSKKEYCATELDIPDDKKKELEHAFRDLATQIVAMEDGIKELGKMVVEAIEQRKQENEEHTVLTAQNSAAKDVMNFAKKRSKGRRGRSRLNVQGSPGVYCGQTKV